MNDEGKAEPVLFITPLVILCRLRLIWSLLAYEDLPRSKEKDLCGLTLGYLPRSFVIGRWVNLLARHTCSNLLEPRNSLLGRMLLCSNVVHNRYVT